MRQAGEIRLVPVYDDPDTTGPALQHLRPELERRFRAATTVDPPMAMRPEWLESRRRQYRGDLLLDALVEQNRRPDSWRLAIAHHDLFVPGINFIFGQATVAGCCAVISTARLRPAFYDKPHDDRLFQRRVLTEAVHELGHVAGLDHCPNPFCVMHFSNTIDDTDRKGPDFCNRCHR